MAAEFRRRACNLPGGLSKSSLLAMVEGTSSAEFFDNLDEDEWIITSFNPTTREACVTLITSVGNRPISITLPPLTVDKPVIQF